MALLNLLARLPVYQVARGLSLKPPLPINYTLGLTFKCQARCLTCRIYEREPVEEMTVEEWQKVFRGLGRSPYWVTFSGGEPFLYKDIVEVYYDLVAICKPAIVNIPTNGLMTDRIVDWVWQMAKISPETRLVVNVSIDHCDSARNDEIRGVKGAFDKSLDTVLKLQGIRADNLTVGIHTVISKFNVGADFADICWELAQHLKHPDHYITEIAEKRNELRTVGLGITPGLEEYREAVYRLLIEMDHSPRSLIKAFRMEYYRHVVRWLKGNGMGLPCYAGYASCQIAPDSMVWFCCIRAKSIGNLREAGYDLNKVWNSPEAKNERKAIKDCMCPMANVSYTNMLLNLPSLVRVVRNLR